MRYYVIKTTFLQENGKAKFFREYSEETYSLREEAKFACAEDAFSVENIGLYPLRETRYDIIQMRGR